MNVLSLSLSSLTAPRVSFHSFFPFLCIPFFPLFLLPHSFPWSLKEGGGKVFFTSFFNFSEPCSPSFFLSFSLPLSLSSFHPSQFYSGSDGRHNKYYHQQQSNFNTFTRHQVISVNDQRVISQN